MTTPLYCLFGFAVWTLLLVGSIITIRSCQVLLGRVKANEFTPGVPHGSDWYWRLNRAHVNAVENLTLFAVLVGLISHLNLHTQLIDATCVTILVARIIQSTAHVISNSVGFVFIRFPAFVIQWIGFATLAGRIALN